MEGLSAVSVDGARSRIHGAGRGPRADGHRRVYVLEAPGVYPKGQCQAPVRAREQYHHRGMVRDILCLVCCLQELNSTCVMGKYVV
ncbi:hypothetical protein NDU88_000109 [Pleurodeles waltl]|uniref:Uncharacterized protein n=1 Tax=Pleurodeles waltl TaxID=8319 RepID=A0AAV7TG52_PLEWA|nr:hypothetical protein NDU88_000109 [Pleurodeles waltl]